MEKLLYEKSKPGRRGVKLPKLHQTADEILAALPAEMRRAAPAELPEANELEVVRHFTRLSQSNFSIETNFYPLGSCTMKYNAKANERAAALPGFADLHPQQTNAEDIQGMLHVYYETQRWLCEVCGMAGVSLAPMAGAQGELAGLLVIRAWLDDKIANGDESARDRNIIIVPKSAHGTNPASAALAGFKVREIPENDNGCVDIEALREAADPATTAGLMLTNPNTLGVFERRIAEVAEVIHEAGGLVYYDGANLNAIAGRARPGDMGFDIVHLNLHKTFSTPHGGGGPGAGPVGVGPGLEKFLPTPLAAKAEDGTFTLIEETPHSIGRMGAFHGNAGVIVRAYSYMLMLGAEGIRRVAEIATLNANYIKKKIEGRYNAPYEGVCKHEFVLSLAGELKEHKVTAFNVAKRLLDYGFHSPTVYFPTTVREALLIEPTETETKETLDEFIDAMLKIADEIEAGSEDLHNAPVELEIGRVDDVKAARELNVCCRM